MSNTSSSATPFIHAQQYSSFILNVLHDGMLPDNFYRNVSDFGSGTTLNIKTIGRVTIQEVEEDTPLQYSPIETGNIQLSITDFVGSAWYVTDVLKQDGEQIEALMAGQSMEAARAIQENFETRLLAVINDAQTANAANVINGHAHRKTASGTNETMELIDIIETRLALDKANVPNAGRVAIVDPVVAASMTTKFQGSYNVDANPAFQAVLQEGFTREHRFVMHLFGFDIWTSNRLPDVASGQGDGTTNLAADGVANIFMCVLDDNCKPAMVAWRQQPQVEGERNKDRKRDEFVQTARWGVGIQREDTYVVILTQALAIS